MARVRLSSAPPSRRLSSRWCTAAARLGVDPARCVVFEDAPAGLAAGRAAGMTTVALTTTHRAEELVADVVVKDLSAVSAQATAGGVEITTAE